MISVGLLQCDRARENAAIRNLFCMRAELAKHGFEIVKFLSGFGKLALRREALIIGEVSARLIDERVEIR